MSKAHKVDDIEQKFSKFKLENRSDSGIALTESDESVVIEKESYQSTRTLIKGSTKKSTDQQSTTKTTQVVHKMNSFEDGAKLNQYTLKEDLGRGAYGMVKLVYNEDDDNLYAMKILSKKKLIRQAGFSRRPPRNAKKVTTPLDRVYREIALLKKLNHPNVIKLIEVLDDSVDDSLYMVFELMEKGEIIEIPTDKPLNEESARKYFIDTVLGLEYLHHQKIIHRDIKPSNLLLDEHGNVKIADLGVSQEFSGGDAEMTSTVGTPAFLPPEALSGEKDTFLGKPVDIWALGVTLFSILFGKVPFHSEFIIELHEKICKDDVIFPKSPYINDNCKELLLKMLDKNPSTRIALQQIKTHSWVTNNGVMTLPTENENCHLVTISDEDVKSCVKVIPRLNTLILVKSMLKHHSFRNPLSPNKKETLDS